MDEHQLICYLKSGTCLLRNSVCCAHVITLFPFKSPLQLITIIIIIIIIIITITAIIVYPSL